MNRASSIVFQFLNMIILPKADLKMKPNKRDLYVVDLLRKSVATGNPCLDLSYERLGDAGVLFLVRMKDLSHLTQLNLSWNELTCKGVEALAQCDSLAGLTTLILDAMTSWHWRNIC